MKGLQEVLESQLTVSALPSPALAPVSVRDDVLRRPLNAGSTRSRAGVRASAVLVMGLAAGQVAYAANDSQQVPTGDPAMPSACLDWHSPDVDVIEGRLPAYRTEPALRYAMGQAVLGFGVVRTVIELMWQPGASYQTQTLLDVTTTGDLAGGVSFYRAENGLNMAYVQCGWGADACTPATLSYRYEPSAAAFVGTDASSSDALLHICPPGYFDSTRALKRRSAR